MNQLSSSVTDSGAAVAWLIVVYIVLAAAVVLFVAGVISVARAPGLTSMARAVWILALLVFPLLGSLVWFTVGRRYALSQEIVVRVTTAFFERHLRHRSEPILDIPTDYYAELEDRTDTIG